MSDINPNSTEFIISKMAQKLDSHIESFDEFKTENKESLKEVTKILKNQQDDIIALKTWKNYLLGIGSAVTGFLAFFK